MDCIKTSSNTFVRVYKLFMGSQNLEKEEMFFRRSERLYAHLSVQTRPDASHRITDTRELSKQGKDCSNMLSFGYLL